jgi:hypothetical protein
MSGTGRTKWGTKFVLVVLAAACGGGAWYARGQQATVGSRAESEATTTAASYITVDLAKAMKQWAPAEAPDKLRRGLEAVVLADPQVTAVRVFDADGALVFSSVAADATVADPAVVQAALAGPGSIDDSDATALRTYAVADGLVGEVEQDATEVRSTATLPWMIGQYGGIGIAVVLLGSALFAGNGTKPAKQPKKTKKTTSASVKQTKNELAGDDPEVAKLRAKADKAEQSRRAMEDQLNTLRSQILSGDAGSQARVGELEGHLQDSHTRVTQLESTNVVLTARVAELETAVANSGPAQQRAASLEADLAATKGRAQELEQQLRTVEAKASLAQTSAAGASGQVEEAHVKARQAEVQVQEAVDRALDAERRVEALQARLDAVGANGGATSPSGDEDGRALRDAAARAESAELLLRAAEARAVAAEARAAEVETAARSTRSPATAGSPAVEGGVRELEIALADARAAAWEAQPEVEGPSLGVVETHAVPEDEEARSEVPQAQLGEADAIRAELERMGHIVEHAGEAGDVDDLRGRLAKTAARKKGRSAAVEDRLSRS